MRNNNIFQLKQKTENLDSEENISLILNTKFDYNSEIWDY